VLNSYKRLINNAKGENEMMKSKGAIGGQPEHQQDNNSTGNSVELNKGVCQETQAVLPQADEQNDVENFVTAALSNDVVSNVCSTKKSSGDKRGQKRRVDGNSIQNLFSDSSEEEII
jgi:hypothetical protein